MSNPLFPNLSKGALAALPYISGLVSQGGLPTSQILQQVRAAGFSIRTQTLYDVVGVLTGNISAARALRVTPTSQVLNPSTYGVAPGFQNTNFRYTVLTRAHNRITGETVNSYVTVSSDDALSQDQILATAESYVSGYDTFGTIEIDDIAVTQALRSADFEV